MSDILESLKLEMQECQARFQAAQQKLAAYNAEFQLVAQEFNAYQILVKAHTAKAQIGPMMPDPGSVAPVQTAQATVNDKSEGNKTEAVRELLRQNPVGMTPGDMWKNLESQISNRTYLYSILKRLKDREEVRAKRGKYYLNARPEANQEIVIQ